MKQKSRTSTGWTLVVITALAAGGGCKNSEESGTDGSTQRSVTDGSPASADGGVDAGVDPVDAGSVPGQWGTTDTMEDVEFISCDSPYVYQGHRICWAGTHDLRAQWTKFLASFIDPTNDNTWFFAEHAKGEPPDNTYYLWHYDQPMPEGTRILIEGDFPHARYFNIQVASPSEAVAFPPPTDGTWARVTGDGSALPEIVLADQDIVPDPGSVNPFLPGADRTATKRHYHLTLELRNGNAVVLNQFGDKNAALPPQRAPGNLRIGGTFKHNDNSNKINSATGAPYGFRGPYIWVRNYLVNKGDKWGGVKPPVIRIQFPGQPPVLAPISREQELSELKLLDPYSIEDNPALGDADGRSVKELEAMGLLEERAITSVTTAGAPSTRHSPAVWKVFNHDGADERKVKIFKVFNTAHYIHWLQGFQMWRLGTASAEQLAAYALTMLPDRTRKFSGMGPNLPAPANADQNSGHCVHNSYGATGLSIGDGELLVIRGKAPNIARTLSGDAVMGPTDQLRYIGLMLGGGGKGGGENSLRLTPVVNIVDEEMVLDAEGRYTIVIGKRSDQPVTATAENGVTWRTWTLGNALSLNARFLSTADPIWEHAPQNLHWAQGDYSLGIPIGAGTTNVDSLKQIMGEYFPEAEYMTAAEVAELLADETRKPRLPVSYMPPARTSPVSRTPLTVNLTPGAVTNGKWRLNNGPWRTSGETFHVPMGRHHLSFAGVPGTLTPSEALITVGESAVTYTTTYEPTNGTWKSGPCSGTYCYTDSSIETILSAPDGNLYAMGTFSSIDSVAAKGVARFNSSLKVWEALGSGINGGGEALAVYRGALVVGGTFTSPGHNVAVWDGTTWKPVGQGTDAPVRALFSFNDELIAGGQFTVAGSVNAAHVARWTNNQWAPMGQGMDGHVHAFTQFGTDLIAAGAFKNADGVRANNIARWDGNMWLPLGEGLDGAVYALTVFNNQLFATGDFTHAGGREAQHVARWNGQQWEALGSGLSGTAQAYGRALTVWNNTLVVGGNFTRAGDRSARRVASWDGTTWEPLGNGFTNWVEGLAVHQDKLVSCGWFNNALEGGPASIATWEPL